MLCSTTAPRLYDYICSWPVNSAPLSISHNEISQTFLLQVWEQRWVLPGLSQTFPTLQLTVDHLLLTQIKEWKTGCELRNVAIFAFWVTTICFIQHLASPHLGLLSVQAGKDPSQSPLPDNAGSARSTLMRMCIHTWLSVTNSFSECHRLRFWLFRPPPHFSIAWSPYKTRDAITCMVHAENQVLAMTDSLLWSELRYSMSIISCITLQTQLGCHRYRNDWNSACSNSCKKMWRYVLEMVTRWVCNLAILFW